MESAHIGSDASTQPLGFPLRGGESELRAGAAGKSVCYVPALSCNCESILYGNAGATVELARNAGEHAPLRLARRDDAGLAAAFDAHPSCS